MLNDTADSIKYLVQHLKATNDRRYIKLSKHLEVIGGLFSAQHLLLCKISLHAAYGGPDGGRDYERRDLKHLQRKIEFCFFRYKGIREFIYGDMNRLIGKMLESGIRSNGSSSELTSFFDSCEELYFVHKIENQKKIK